MFHDLDPDSNEFYKIAKEYAICSDFEYVSEVCLVEMKTVRALTKDQRFLDLVEDYKKSFGDKEPFQIKVESNRLLILNETTRVALSKTDKNKMKAIDSFFIISQDLKKGNNAKDSGNKGTTVNLQIGEEKYDEDEE